MNVVQLAETIYTMLAKLSSTKTLLSAKAEKWLSRNLWEVDS